MKIVFFRHSLLSRGGDKMIVANANNLAASGHQVCIAAAVFDTIFTLDPRITLYQLPFTNKLGTILTAIKTKFDADLVVADIIPMACFLSSRNRKKVVYFAQDYDESYYSSAMAKLFIRLLYLIGLCLLRIRAIAVAHHLAETFQRRFKVRASVVENGVDRGVFYPEPDPCLVSDKNSRKALLLLSRSDRRKGFDVARDVVKCLSASHTSLFEVWTVGEQCAGLFPDLVHRDFGYVDEDKLRRVMSSADVFLYPTRHEGLPLMPFEAMACGCPVVTTTAVPYAVHEENGLVAQIEDRDTLTHHLLVLLDDEDLHSRLIETGKQFASRHSLSEATRQFEAVLAGMLPR